MQGWGFLDISPLKASVFSTDRAHHAMMMMCNVSINQLKYLAKKSFFKSSQCIANWQWKW